MEDNKNLCMDWGDSIENEGQELITLEEGDYFFKVTGFERARFVGSTKIPPCNKATLTLEVRTDKGIAIAKTDLILYRTLEWKLCQFFRCIGQKKHGEKLTMDWNAVLGSYGKAHFKPRSYENNYGETKQANDVDKFLDYDAKEMTKYIVSLNSSAVDTDDLPFKEELSHLATKA